MVSRGTLRLMRAIGVLGLVRGCGGVDPGLIALAKLNKVQALVDDRYLVRYGEFLGFLEHVARRMDGVDYVIVKTMLPLPRIPADIDLIIGGGYLGRVLGMFRRDGFRLIDWAPYGATLYSDRYGYYLDVATDLSVSGLVYMDGDYLMSHSEDRRMDGVVARAPVKPLDLLVVMAHSVIKEWTFTLSDYYAAVLWLSHITEALKYAGRLGLVRTLLLFMSVVERLSDMAYGPSNPISAALRGLTAFNVDNMLMGELPARYGLEALLPCYVERFNEEGGHGQRAQSCHVLEA